MDQYEPASRSVSKASLYSQASRQSQARPKPVLEVADGSLAPDKRGKLHAVKNKTKRRAKEFLGLPTSSANQDEESDEDGDLLRSVAQDPAFHPTYLEKKLDMQHAKSEGPIKQAVASLDRGLTAIAHPRKTAIERFKHSAAGKISASTQGPPPADIAYLEHEKAHVRKSSRQRRRRGSGSSTATSEMDTDMEYHSVEKSERLEEQRDAMIAAWSTSRVQRASVVRRDNISFPHKVDYEQKDDAGAVVRVHWLDWIGKLLLYYTQGFASKYVDDFDTLPFDANIFRGHVERLIMVSGPWQTWMMDLRSLYRWENPRRTAKLLLCYTFFWYINYVGTYFWGWGKRKFDDSFVWSELTLSWSTTAMSALARLIWKIVSFKLYPVSLVELKAAARRSADRETVAYQLGEMINRHGEKEWIDPFLQEVGPFAQVQVNDLANLMEVLSNFHQWKSPYKTLCTLTFFTCCLLTAALTSVEYSLKIVFFILGGTFFLCWPISSLYPRYRLLVSPVKWVMWDIPTHAEWSFAYLQSRASMAQQAMFRKQAKENTTPGERSPDFHGTSYHDSRETQSTPDLSSDDDTDGYETAASTSSVLSAVDIISFRARWQGMSGRLVINHAGLRFERGILRKEGWEMSFLDMAEMRKERLNHAKLHISRTVANGGLYLKSIDGQVQQLDSVKERDECFNYIIGYSGLQWQGLQPVIR